jgi:hypothetical protein
MQSSLNPNAYTAQRFSQGLMPSRLKDDLTEEDLNSVVAFLLTLK